MRKRLINISIFSLVVLLLGGTFLLGYLLVVRMQNPSISPQVATEKSPNKFTWGNLPLSTYDDFYRQAAGTKPADSRSAIVAHHLVVGNEIAKIFTSLGSSQTKQVILLSPNHFNVGRGAAISSAGTWATPYGDVEADGKTISALAAADKDLQLSPEPFVREHGINTITPFVKKSFPNAKIIPIIFEEDFSPEQAQLLVETLHELAPRAVLIASVDMSHYLPLTAQAFHDDLTERTLRVGELRHNLEIDSNATLRVLFAWNKLIGAQSFQETFHDSSLARGIATKSEDNTSHILGYFQSGIPSAETWTSFQFVGDVMLDRGTRKEILANGVDYPWQNVTRFLSGVDHRIANLEGTINEQPSTYTYNPPFRFVFDPSYVKAMMPYIDIVSQANNHAADVGSGAGQKETHKWLDELKLPWFGSWDSPDPVYDFEVRGEKFRLIGYHTFQPNEPRLLELIKEGKTAGRFVMVMPHWGVEYQYGPSSSQEYLARQMTTAGANLIIGAHPHVVEGIDVVGQTPVAYSLGNFVFDQRDPETWQGLSLGVIKTPTELVLYFMPVGTKDSQPTPLDGAAAAQVLKIISDNSPTDYQENIKQAKIMIPYGKN